MSERSEYLPGVPCWVDSSQPDPGAVLPFYSGLFGWEFENVMPEGSGGEYHMARIRGGDVAAIGPVPDGAPAVAMWSTYVAVVSADEAAERVRNAGGTVLQGPFDVMDAGRMAVVADTEGAVFCVWEAKENIGATVVNEAGALVFNGLASQDLEAAQGFYGAVFGWKLLSIPAGHMWMLPGYGDYLEQLTPGMREGMEQMGAPEGFIDVVAQVYPIAEGDDAEAPHWRVTFATDDVHATADRAKELGGEVLDPPADAPWVRNATLRDPGGAAFVMSQFVAENSNLTA
jgi:predicted enzyme related to lactoylglutathione lyase